MININVSKDIYTKILNLIKASEAYQELHRLADEKEDEIVKLEEQLINMIENTAIKYNNPVYVPEFNKNLIFNGHSVQIYEGVPDILICEDE